MQIYNTFSPQYKYSQNKPLKNNSMSTAQITQQAVETAGTVGMTPAEINGRTQVNFCGIDHSNPKLTKDDTNFLKGIGTVFRLSKEEEKQAETIVKNFLKETKFQSLSSMKSDDIFEFSNEIAYLTETLSNAVGLSDYENSVLGDLLIWQINQGDITKLNINRQNIVNANKYTKDYTPFEHLYTQNGIEDIDITMNAFSYLKNRAKKMDCNSIFDLFNQKNIKIGQSVIENLQNPEFGNLTKEQRTNLLLSMFNYSKMTDKQRISDINIHSDSEIFNDAVNTIIIANKISENYNIKITEKLLNMLEKRKTKTEVHKNGCPAIEVAYKIIEEYDLPADAMKNIVQIIEKYENTKDPEKFNDFLDALRNNK